MIAACRNRIAWVAILLGAAACELQKERGARDIELVSVDLGRSLRPDKTVPRPTRTFGPRDTVYAALRLFGVNTTAHVRVHWYRGNEILHADRRAISPNGLSHTEFHYAPSGGFRAGTHEVAVFVDHREVQRVAFEVE